MMKLTLISALSCAFFFVATVVTVSADNIRNVAEQLLLQLRIEASYVDTKALDDWYGVSFKTAVSNQVPITIYVSKDGASAVYGEIFHKGRSLSMLNKLTKSVPDTSYLSKTDRPAFGLGEDVIVFLSPFDGQYEDYLKKITVVGQTKYHFILKLYVKDSDDISKAFEQYHRILMMSGQSLSKDRIVEMIEEDRREAQDIGVVQSPTIVVQGMILRLKF
jgi:hypothetical protein